MNIINKMIKLRFFSHLSVAMITTIMIMLLDTYTNMEATRYYLVSINTLIFLYVIELIKLSLWGSK